MHKRILLVIQRASDFTEMYRAIEHLNAHHYECIILFYGVGNTEADNAVLELIKQAKAKGIIKRMIVKVPPRRGTEKYKKIFPQWFFFMKNPEKNSVEKQIDPKIASTEMWKVKIKSRFILVKLIKLIIFIPFLFYNIIYFSICLITNTVRGIFMLFAQLRKPLINYDGMFSFIYKSIWKKINQLNLGVIFNNWKISNQKRIQKFLSSIFTAMTFFDDLSTRVYLRYQAQKNKIVIFGNLIINVLKKCVSMYFSIIPFYFININLFNNLLKRLKINIILLPEDVVGFVTPLIIKAGHRNNIPSLIVPYTIANQEEAFQSLKQAEAYSTKKLSNRILGYFFRAWLKKDKQHAALRLPAAYILGHVFTRTSPPDPWMMNSGFANAIAIENQAMADYYLCSGISPQKLKVVGSFCDDDIARVRQNKRQEIQTLAAFYGFDASKPILLIGGCPNQLIGHPPGFDFSNIEEMVNFIVQCLEPLRHRYNFILRPHPNFMELGGLFEKHGWLSVKHDTIKLIPLADIYIAFASATIRWAIASAVPVINYDVFHYDFSEYKQSQGVINVTLPDEFKKAVNSLQDLDYLEGQRKKVAFESPKWGMLDGLSANRICELIEELMKLNPVPRIAG